MVRAAVENKAECWYGGWLRGGADCFPSDRVTESPGQYDTQSILPLRTEWCFQMGM